MYARSTLLEIDTMRVSVADALKTFKSSVMPRLREQPGFLGVYAMSTPEGQAMLLSFWETAEQADASGDSGWYPEVLQRYVTMFRTSPGREHYEVDIAVPPLMHAAES